MFEYEFENTMFTQEQIDNRAKEKGLSTEQYLTNNPSINKIEVEKTPDVATQDAPVASEVDMASSLDDISSASGFERHEFLKDKDAEGNVIGYSLFEKTDSDVKKALELYYPGFKFETTGNIFNTVLGGVKRTITGEGFEDQSDQFMNMIKVTAPDGTESDAFQVRIGVGSTKPEDIFREQEETFNKLTSFIDKHSGTKELEEYQKSVQANINQYKIFSAEVEEAIDKQGIEEKYLIDNPAYDFNKPESKDNSLKIINRDIFKPYNVTSVSHGGGSMGIGGTGSSTTTKTITPYEKELAEARKALGDKATEEQAQDYVVKKLIEKDIIAQREIVADDIIDNSEEYQFLLDRGAKEFANQYSSKIKLRDTLRNELLEGDKLKRLKEINSQIVNPDYNFKLEEGEDFLYLQDGRVIPAKLVKEFEDLENDYRIDINHYDKLQEELFSSFDGIESLGLKLDLLKRNYNGVHKFFATTGLRAAELLDGASYGISAFTGANTLEDDKEFIKRKNLYNSIRNKFEKDVAFDSAFDSFENFFTFVAQETANQLPIFLALAAPGGAGFGIIGMSGFGEQYSNMTSQELDPKIRAEYSDMEKFFASLGYGSAEVVFGSLPTYFLLRGLGKSTAQSAIMRGKFKEWRLSQISKGVAGAGMESIGEGLTIMTQNAINGIDIMENVDHAMFSGLLFGSTFASVPVIKGQVLK